MRILDPGHFYSLQELDRTTREIRCRVHLRFVKRRGLNFPGNLTDYPGTTCQEVGRVLVDRIQYLDRQESHWVNKVSVGLLRVVINLFEYRAARRHDRRYRFVWEIEKMATDPGDMHVRFGEN